MPTQKESLQFVRENKQALKGGGLYANKAPSNMASGELNAAIDKATGKIGGAIENKWKRMKLKSDASPAEAQAVGKKMKRAQMAAGTLGGSAKVPQRATMKKDTGTGKKLPPTKKVGRPKKQATTIDGEIANLMKQVDKRYK